MAHILVVEDERHLAQGIKFNLELEGYDVSTVDNGVAAMQSIQRDNPAVDLVILDLMLPGMSGYAVCQELRALGAEIPVLILSARTLTEDRTRGFEAGADQYLTKPFELDELLARVKGLLIRHRRRTQATALRDESMPQYRFGDAHINFQTFEVTVGQQVRRMTPLELKLLQYLIQNEGRVVTRHELLENVWGQPGHLQTRAPDQFIRRLRKVFEQDSSLPRHFLTVRDAGYRFVADPDRD